MSYIGLVLNIHSYSTPIEISSRHTMLVNVYFLWDPDLSTAYAASFQRIWLCTLLINKCFIHIVELSFWIIKLQSLREGLAWLAYEGFNQGGERHLTTLSNQGGKGYSWQAHNNMKNIKADTEKLPSIYQLKFKWFSESYPSNSSWIAFNRFASQTTNYSPFKVVYSQNSFTLQNKNPINAIDMKLLLTTNHCSGDNVEELSI